MNTSFNNGQSIELSHNYGVNTSYYPGVALESEWAGYYASGISGNGQYMTIAGYQTYSGYSTNYGVNWTEIGISQGQSNLACAANYSGSIQIIAANHRSTDYGASWYNSYLAANKIDICGSGQYGISSHYTPNAQLKVSNDYCASWRSVGPTGKTWRDVAISKIIPV
jgi:hypothetical protein